MRYLPQLDALRGLCVAAVFLFHAQFVDCGWAGVQAFFVLSGFLITGVLLAARHGEGAAAFFRNFYARRALRIFPVYLVYIAAVFALAPLAGAETSVAIREHVAQYAPFLLTYTQNFYSVVSGPASPFFGHLWTLSIEEQFYLLWPLCVFLLDRKRLLLACKILVVAGPLLRLLEVFALSHVQAPWATHAERVVYFLTTSHLDAFALGALLNFRNEDALVSRVASWPLRRVLLPTLLTGLLLLLAAKRAHLGVGFSSLGWSLYLPYFQAQIWGYSVLNLLFFVVIANAGKPGPLLGNGWLQRLGKVSYGFYIFHLPMIWIAATVSGSDRGGFGAYNLVVNAIAFVATWALAELSFRFLESPALALKKRFASGPLAAQPQPLPAA